MDTAKLKTYAPKARQDFIAAVTRRAAKFGLTAKGTSPVREEGQLVIIEGQPYPKAVAVQRKGLAERIEQQGFQQVVETTAYTWFNRFAAIRFMELHGYLDHSFRVLSPSPQRGEGRGEGGIPEILENAQHIDLPGLDRQRVINLKMDGTRDEELYRDLLLAQCHALHQAMPFLFERVDDETELLLPDNLLQTDSLIRELVTAIPEENWQEVEIIGWLYQFYISEKKDQVIGKVVKSEDIPAATQLFTPNWIVKYMVQNSLGAQWLATYPHSPLKGQMEFYVEPAVQTPEVQAQLEKMQRDWLVKKGLGVRDEGLGMSEGAIVASEDNPYPLTPSPYTLSPEHLTLIDPACGSGHILVEAYDLFKAIYLERGYQQRDVAQLILEKNLFGLDIDGRAAQLTGFALMMKGRADDRRFFERGVKLNVMALVDGRGIRGEGLGGDSLCDAIDELVALFEHATTFGSLIQVPEGLAAKLPALNQLSEATSQDLFVSEALKRLGPLVRQAELLAAQYDAVVANPPYMGMKAMNGELKALAASHYPDFKLDTYSVFVARALDLVNQAGKAALVTMHSWMFLHRFEAMRRRVLTKHTLLCLGHLGARAFSSISGEVVQTCCFVINRPRIAGYHPTFSRCVSGAEDHKQASLKSRSSRYSRFQSDDFLYISGSILAYWISKELMSHFHGEAKVSDYASPRHGMVTSDNERFLRFHWEVSRTKQGYGYSSREAALESNKKWFPYNKGGPARRWYGNAEYLLNWEHDGQEVVGFARELYGSPSRKIQSREFYFRDGLTWSALGSGDISLRANGGGFLFDSKGSSMFFESDQIKYAMVGLFNSNVAASFISVMSPTLDFSAGSMANMRLAGRVLAEHNEALANCATTCVGLSRKDWDTYERSWDFQSLPILGIRDQGPGASADKSSPLIPNPSTLSKNFDFWITRNRATIAEMKRLEEENNRLFIDAYGLADELTADVPIEQITLTVNPAYRYGKRVDSEQWSVDRGFGEELEARFRQDTMRELVSYAIGCMMGRYRLDRPGLIYAHEGNREFWSIFEGVNSGQWAVDSQQPSGPSGVAEGDAAGREGVSHDESLSPGGTVRVEQPDSAGCGVDSLEHCRRAGASIDSGVSSVPLSGDGVKGGGGNANDDRGATGLRDTVAGQGDHGAAGRDLQNVAQFAQQASEQGTVNSEQTKHLSTNHCSLSTSSGFQPDEDGIVPLTDTEWFDDDAAHRLVEFISVAWDKAQLENNLTFLADNLSPKKNESSRETLRRYLCDSFFKDHLQTYKKRPIYWLFSSGKQKAFQCLVYLHRYNEGTLARMRMEYVVPLQSKMAARIDKFADDIQSAITSAQAKRLQKERDKLTRQLDELRRYDEQLRHHADLRISLDLDDGVKVNYGKFGDLLAEVKVVTGKVPQ